MVKSNGIMFTLILGATFLSSCAMDVSSSSDDTSNDNDYYAVYSADDDFIDENFIGKETVSDAGKISISLKAPEGASVRYLQSDVKSSLDYPSATNSGYLLRFTVDSTEKNISNVSKKYVLFAYCSDRFSWDEAMFGYWEVENYTQTITKLDVTFAQSGTSLTISATDGSSVVSSSVVHYTLDGTDPTISSPLIVTGTQTVTVSLGVVVKAKAFASSASYLDSDVKSYSMTGVTPVGEKYFYIDTTFKGASVKITFEDGAPGISGTYVVADDGKIPVAISGNPKISVNLIIAGKWCDANGVDASWSQSSVWNGDQVTLISYKNGGMIATGRTTIWTRK